jgi:hypothetical protein
LRNQKAKDNLRGWSSEIIKSIEFQKIRYVEKTFGLILKTASKKAAPASTLYK